MDQRWDFFKQGETTWGEFYPTHYILAGYESDADAQAAEEAFRASGVAAEDVRAATGQFVAGYLETRGDRNALDKLGSKLADAVGTENDFVAQDTLFARERESRVRQPSADVCAPLPACGHRGIGAAQGQSAHHSRHRHAARPAAVTRLPRTREDMA